MSVITPPERGKGKLLDQVRAVVRYKHYSIRTERTYCEWIKQFILFHGKRHPGLMGIEEVRAFLTYLAVERQVVPATQNQPLSALLFLSMSNFWCRRWEGSKALNGRRSADVSLSY